MTKYDHLLSRIEELEKRLAHVEGHTAEDKHIVCSECHKKVRGY